MLRFGTAWCTTILWGTIAAAQFTPGRLVVSQLGDGATASGTVPIRLREFTTSGSATGMEVALPTTDAGSNFAIVGSISNVSAGFLLKQSVDKRYLTIIGYGTNASASRTIARIDVDGGFDSSTRFSAAGVNVRSAITTTGTDLWWSGDTGSNSAGGIRYTTLGSSSSGAALALGGGGGSPGPGGLYQVPLNSRVIGIFDDQLYGSSAVGVGPGGSVSFRGVFNVGTGLPTTANQYGAILAGGGGGNTGTLDSAWEFFFANPSTIYVADDDTTAPTSSGLQKWTFSSGSWSKVWAALPDGATGLRGLTGLVTGSSVQLFGVTAVSTNAGANSLVSLSDTLGDTVAPAFTTLVTAETNYVFRGVAFAPVPEPVACMVAASGLGILVAKRLARRRRPASRSRRLAWSGILLWTALSGVVAEAQFTPGRIVVSQYGDGVTTSGNVPITLREFTTSGSSGFQVSLPVVSTAANRPILGSISNTQIGFLKQSADGRFLSIIGAGTAASTITIARIDDAGGVNSTTHFSVASGGGPTPVSAITTNGTDFWWSAQPGNDSTAGTRYVTIGGSTTGIAIGNANSGSPPVDGLYQSPLRMRVLGIFNDQLYGSSYTPMAPAGTVPYSFRGVFSIGTGVPKTGPQYGTMLASQSGVNLGIMDGPWEFYLANASTLYIADDDNADPASGGLQKWVLNSGSWSKIWSVKPDGAIGMRGLTGLVTGSTVQLYGITAVATSTGTNSLVSLSDTLGDTVAPSFTTLATADTNYVFRGVAFAPVPEPAAAVAGLVGLASIAVACRRATHRRGTKG